MKLATHLAFGLTSYSVTSLAVGVPNPGQIAVCLFASMLPDIDISSSKFVRFFHLKRLSRWVERKYGHRGITHSYIFILMVAAFFSPFFLFGLWQYTLYAVVGVFSHIASDMLTKDGVRFLWPSRKRDVWFGSSTLRMESGGAGEIVFGVVCALIAAGCLIGNVSVSLARANIVEIRTTVTAVNEIKVKVRDR